MLIQYIERVVSTTGYLLSAFSVMFLTGTCNCGRVTPCDLEFDSR